MEKLKDMHIHTIYSDGEYSPDEIIKKAHDLSICTIAITDHDTLGGVKAINRDCDLIKNGDIEVYNGIELSAKTTKGRIHILGYDFDLENETLNDKMDELKDNSISSVLSTIEQIKRDYGIRFKYQDIIDLLCSNHNLGRPDIAKLCIKYGYASTVQEAFDKFLNPSYEYVKKLGCRKGITYEECIHLIKTSNGIPVLAHPKTLELDEKEFLKVLKDMIKCGLLGIEVYHSSHTKEEMEYYLRIAEEYGLLVSAGSDYHGPIAKPDISLGTGMGNLKVKKLSLVDELRKRHI